MRSFSALCCILVLGSIACAGEKQVPAVRFECGDYVITFDGLRAWTLWEMSYRGVTVLSGLRGAANGTVVNCKPEKWIGTGHGLEEIEQLKVYVDGHERKFAQNSTYRGKTLSLKKVSSLRICRLWAEVRVGREGILEVNDYEVIDARSVNFIYAFMHSFAVNMREWGCMDMSGAVEQGTFEGTGESLLRKPLTWAAVFDPDQGVGAICVFEKNGWGKQPITFFWDRAGDNKLYFRPDINKSPRLGEKMHFAVKLICFKTKKKAWLQEARLLGEKVRW